MMIFGKGRLIPLATKVTAIVLLIIMVNTVTIAVMSFAIHREDSVQASSDKAMAIAKSASISVDPAEFRKAMETGEKSAHYEHLERQFLKVREDEGLSYFYAGTFDPVGWVDPAGKVDSTTGETMVVSMRIYVEGTVFTLNDDVRRTMFRESAFAAYESGEARVTEPYNFNVDGSKGIAAYAPIFDEGGLIIGLIGVLMPIDNVLARSNDFAMLMLGISALIFAVIVWVPILYLRRSLAKPLAAIQAASNKITNGELDTGMKVRESNDEVGALSRNFATMQGIIMGIQGDIKGILDNALNGRLSHRADDGKYPGEWREVVSKFNGLMDTIAQPIDDVSAALSEIAGGNFGARIEREYKGDFDRIKNSVNRAAADLDTYLAEKERAEADAYRAELAKGQAEAVAEVMLSSARYASKIQRNLLPTEDAFRKAFADHAAIWKPRDIVGGDFYWLRNLEEGTVLCVCDCTGHGTPGALLTMLVSSILDALVSDERCHDTAQIIYMLDRRLAEVLNVRVGAPGEMEINDGCDLVVMYVSKDGEVAFSAGNMSVFTCDGAEVRRYKGQPIYVGEGKLRGGDEVEVVRIGAARGMKFYVASDGLSDQIGGGHNRQFGYKEFERIVLEGHGECQEEIAGRIWGAFERHRGDEPRRDDFELVTFRLG